MKEFLFLAGLVVISACSTTSEKESKYSDEWYSQNTGGGCSYDEITYQVTCDSVEFDSTTVLYASFYEANNPENWVFELFETDGLTPVDINFELLKDTTQLFELKLDEIYEGSCTPNQFISLKPINN